MQKSLSYIDENFCRDLTLSEIAEACGFHSQSYLDYIFKKETGKTLSEYKKSPAVEVLYIRIRPHPLISQNEQTALPKP